MARDRTAVRNNPVRLRSASIQVTLSARQHVRRNLGTRILVTNTSDRPAVQLVLYVPVGSIRG